VNAYEVEAGIGVIAGNTVWSMPERLECEVLQKAHYINTLTFTFIFTSVMHLWSVFRRHTMKTVLTLTICDMSVVIDS